MLYALRKMGKYGAEIKNGGWTWDAHTEGLLDQSVGLVSLGAISTRLIPMLKLFTDDIRVYSTHYDEEIAKVYDGVKGKESELVRFESHGDTRMVYSGFLFEKPINCVISKKALRANADMAYAFNFEGDHGNEKAVSVRRLHCNGNRTEFDCGFVSLT